jgi:stearoyl-CoA desaturase (Delta-9 desaturase)
MFGTRPFNKDILPSDNWFVSVIALGEGWHNFHHKYPRDWRASKDEWWMINPSATLIRIWRLMGLADTSAKAIRGSD